MLGLQQIRPWLQLAGIAIAYRALTLMLWDYLARKGPIGKWLVDTYAESNYDLWHLLTMIHSGLVNLLVAAPFAYLICKIRPDRRWLYVFACVLAIFVWDSRLLLFVQQDFFGFMERIDKAWIYLAMSVSYLPVTLLLWSVIERRRDTSQPRNESAP